MSSSTTPGWTFKANDFKSFLKFRDRTSCEMNAFEVAAAQRLPSIILIHPDGTEEVVTRDDYDHRF